MPGIDSCRSHSYRALSHGTHLMPRRLLNIASIVCLVACVALMGMWVRSYHVKDEWHFPLLGALALLSTLCKGSWCRTSSRCGQAAASAYRAIGRSQTGRRKANVCITTTTRCGRGFQGSSGSLNTFRGNGIRLVALLAPRPHQWRVGNGLPTSLALAVHTSQPVHRDDIPGPRAGNDRLAGSGVDWEVIGDQSADSLAEQNSVSRTQSICISPAARQSAIIAISKLRKLKRTSIIGPPSDCRSACQQRRKRIRLRGYQLRAAVVGHPRRDQPDTDKAEYYGHGNPHYKDSQQ